MYVWGFFQFYLKKKIIYCISMVFKMNINVFENKIKYI